MQLLVLAIKELLRNPSFSIVTNMKCPESNEDSSSKWESGEIIRDTMKTIGNSNYTFITKYIRFNDFNERIGFELEIYKPMVLQSLATWNTDGEIVPTHKQVVTAKAKKITDYAEGTKHFRVAIRIASPYFMLRLVDSFRFKIFKLGKFLGRKENMKVMPDITVIV